MSKTRVYMQIIAMAAREAATDPVMANRALETVKPVNTNKVEVIEI